MVAASRAPGRHKAEWRGLKAHLAFGHNERNYFLSFNFFVRSDLTKN